MDYSVEPEINSIREQASKALRGKSRLPRASRSQKFQDVERIDSRVGQPCVERDRELRQNVDDVSVGKEKHSEKQQKHRSGSDVRKDDELVKHMSNLPGYLQQMERGKNFQGNVLNFGVLDWNRLEKWKNSEEIFLGKHYEKASTSRNDSSLMACGSSKISSAAQSKFCGSEKNKSPSNGLRFNSAHEERPGVWSQGKVSKPRGFETAPWHTVNRRQNLHIKDKSSGENFSGIHLDEGKRKESNNRNKSANELPPLIRRKNVVPVSSSAVKSARDFKTNTTIVEGSDITRQPCGQESIVLLLPRSSPSRGCSKSSQLRKSRTSFDENSTEDNGNKHSGWSSSEEELHYVELYTEIPHSCPLPMSGAEYTDPNMEKCSLVNTLDTKLQFDESGWRQRPKKVPNLPLYNRCLEVGSSKAVPSAQTPQRMDQDISEQPIRQGSSNSRVARNLILKEGPSVPQLSPSYATAKSGPLRTGASPGLDEFNMHNVSTGNKATSRILTTTVTPRRLDHDASEQPAAMGRHPSPGRRFTFGRMTRSLSFKESTSLPHGRSSSGKVKSGPLASEAFAGLDRSNRDNVTANVTAGNIARLSPSTNAETPRRSDQDLADQAETIGRHQSPGRFSFSRMTRTFSFKEGPSASRSSSSSATDKSSAIGSVGLDKFSRDNLSSSNSARFNPSTTSGTPRRSDQNIVEQPDTVGRHSSPGRRFSFGNRSKISKSLDFKEVFSGPQLSSKISKSLDFKEVFSGPQLSSYATVKSRSAGLNLSAGLDRFNQDNISGNNRTRSSSPLRRLLDPLLKPRGVVHSAETVHPSKENLTSKSTKPQSTSELLQNQKHETSSIQALLQLTRKNGLPLFRLVVDNGSDILAAAVKQLPKPGDDASSLIYALYSVHEIKNKRGWMNQGSKGKRSNFGYNIIGQMQISSSHPLDHNGQSVKDQSVSRDSILYSVELGQADKQTPEIIPSKELAAISIKNPIQKESDGEQSSNSNLCFREGFTKHSLENTCTGRENEDSNSTTVILGGVHGLPAKVIPSPSLIWRYGGSCDCGGWDIGCKLQILTTQDQKRNSRMSTSCSTGLDLFFEGGQQEKKPCFSLAPFKTGVYSVEFNSSIPLLQAFFISISFISSHKLHEIFDGILDMKNFSENKIDIMKFPTTIQGVVPTKYVTKPPPSPVGRV